MSLFVNGSVHNLSTASQCPDATELPLPEFDLPEIHAAELVVGSALE